MIMKITPRQCQMAAELNLQGQILKSHTQQPQQMGSQPLSFIMTVVL